MKADFSPKATPETVAGMLEGSPVANIMAVLQQAVDLSVYRWMDHGDEEDGVELVDIEQARKNVTDESGSSGLS